MFLKGKMGGRKCISLRSFVLPSSSPSLPSHSLPPFLPSYLLFVLPPKQGPQPSCFYGPGEENEDEDEGEPMQGEEWWQHGATTG